MIHTFCSDFRTGLGSSPCSFVLLHHGERDHCSILKYCLRKKQYSLPSIAKTNVPAYIRETGSSEYVRIIIHSTRHYFLRDKTTKFISDANFLKSFFRILGHEKDPLVSEKTKDNSYLDFTDHPEYQKVNLCSLRSSLDLKILSLLADRSDQLIIRKEASNGER